VTEPQTVVMYSGGLASFAAAHRIRDEKPVLLFTDTLIEENTLYAFLDASAAFLGLELVRIADGRTPWEVFRDVRMLGNTRADPCSRILKRELARKWVDENAPDADIIFGLDWTEPHRLPAVERNWAPHRVRAPMMDKPYRLKHELVAWVESLGLTPPAAYREGFPHANCGGGCIKAGVGEWTRLYRLRPDTFARWEQEEEELRELLGDVAILRDRTDGTTDPLPLSALRQRIEMGQPLDLWADGAGCGCMV